ncbi:MAG: carboxypeptidase regulatory-like domain-containing protein [Terracidiphilus sp.]
MLILVVSGNVATAQTEQSGSITGIVTDESGAAIKEASVLATNTQTGVARDEQTNSEGIYSIELLPQGVYTVRISSNGFASLEQTQVHLDQSQTLRLSFALKVGEAAATTVEVNSSAVALDVDTTSLSTVVERSTIVDLPLNGRNDDALVNLVPAVRAIGSFGIFDPSASTDGRVQIGGGTPSSNSFEVDGTADENPTSGGPAFIPSPDATDEVVVINHNADAEYGRSSGGTVNFITRSGTKEYHGDLWDFTQNSVLDANNYFTKQAGQPIAPLTQNQYGVTMGGPIVQKKTFFFYNWEGFKEATQSQAFYTMPTDLQKQGDFSQTFNASGNLIVIYDPLSTMPNPASPGSYIRTPFQDNKIPSYRLNPVAQAIAKYYPEPNLPGNTYTGVNNFFGSASTTYNRNNMGLRVDHYFTPARQLAARYTWDRTHALFPQYYGAGNPGTIGNSPTQYLRDSAILAYSDALRSDLLFEVRAGFNRFGIDRIPVSTGFDATKLDFPASLDSQQQFPIFPYFGLSTTASIGSVPGDTATQRGNDFSTGGTLTWDKGRHSLKTGVELRLYQWNSIQPSGLLQFAFDQTYTKGPNPLSSATDGYDFADFMLGNPTSGTLWRYSPYEYSTRYGAAFVQDDWKIARRLTANVGLRYDHEGATTARHNNIANYNPNLQTTDSGIPLTGGLQFPGVNGLSRGNRDTDLWDYFAPRVGLSYQFMLKTVARAAYGIYFLPTTGDWVRLSDSGYSSQTAYLATTNGALTPSGSLSNPFPSGIVLPTGSTLGALTGLGTTIAGNSRRLVPGYAEQYSIDVERQVGAYIIELGYLGSHGVKLPADYSYDYLTTSQLSQGTALLKQEPNPYAGIITSGALSQPTVPEQSLITQAPQFTGVTSLSNWAGSNYQAGTVEVKHNYGANFFLLLSYTWSKFLDNNLGDGENQYADSGSNAVQYWGNLKAEKALSTSSMPQRLVTAAGYSLPLGKSGAFVYRALVGGWRGNMILSAESGNAISVTANAPTDGGSRPNLVGNPRLPHPTAKDWLNLAAFQTIPAFTFGDTPRNLPSTFTQPLFNIDGSILKSIAFADRYRIEVRGEAFNLTNRVTFGTPNANISSTSFGQITSIRTGTQPRIVQLGVKGYF